VVIVHGRRLDPDELRWLIAERDLTLSAFAGRAGISRRHLHAILAEEKAPTERMVLRLARALDASVDDFTVVDDPAAEDGEAA
jgi:transcriptional regulator with XRE-family HTH domain